MDVCMNYFFETVGMKYISNRCDFTNDLALLFVGWSFLHLRCQQPAQPSLLMFIYLCRSKRIRLNQDSLMMGRNRQRELHQAVRVGVEYYQKSSSACKHKGDLQTASLTSKLQLKNCPLTKDQ